MCSKRRLSAAALCACFLVALQAGAAGDALFAGVNGTRTGGCRGKAAQPALRRDDRIDRAAEAIAAGEELKRSLATAGYRAARVVTLEVTGADEAAMAAALAKQSCEDIADPAWRDAGLALRGTTAWILLASPLDAPPAPDAAADRVLALVNAARATRRRCGTRRFEASPPLAHSAELDRAARAHAQDMAARAVLSHAGGDGSTAGERATRAGYRWRLVAENIASGQSTPEQAVADWLDSPHHCANLMDPAYTEMGVGYAAGAADVYWSQLFGTPAN
jgi:uncharacterized protein YkwD